MLSVLPNIDDNLSADIRKVQPRLVLPNTIIDDSLTEEALAEAEKILGEVTPLTKTKKIATLPNAIASHGVGMLESVSDLPNESDVVTGMTQHSLATGELRVVHDTDRSTDSSLGNEPSPVKKEMPLLRIGTKAALEGNDVDQTVKVGSFRLKRRTGRAFNAQVAFWPRGRPVSMVKLRDIISKSWGLEPPNVVVYIDAGAAHPKHLSTKLLRELPQFDDWREQARIQEELHRSRAGGSHPAPLNQIDIETNTVDSMMFDKLVTVFTGILEASEKTNNYIIVDRTLGSSSTAELLLETALQQTDASPVILVIEKRRRILDNFSEEAERQIQQINEIEEKTILHGTDQLHKRADVSALYNATDFADPGLLNGVPLAELPLPRLPDREHVVENGVDVRVSGQEKGERINPKRLWAYHYTQYMFGSGTHYIFLEDDDHLINPEALGPQGGIFAHGGTLTFKRMRMWLQRGKPTVMLFNTGGVTQAFASLHRAVLKSDYEDSIQVLKNLQITSLENWATTFGPPEIVMMRELQKRAPVAIRKAIVSVDILRDSAEDVMQVVTGCFASAAGHLPELGLRTAETDVVLRAWAQHLTLFSSAATQKIHADVFFFLSIFLFFVTTLASTTKIQLEDSEVDAEVLDNSLHLLVVLVPIVSAIIATLIQRKRALEKWGVLYVTSMRIVAEIYKFRARVLEYDPPAISREEGPMGDEGEHTQPAGQDARDTRMMFVNRIQELFANVLDGDMSKDALNCKITHASYDEYSKPTDPIELRKHVRMNLLWMKGDVILDSKQLTRGEETTVDIFQDIDEDDFMQPISIETYVEKRMKPLLIRYSMAAPRLSKRLSFLENLSMVINAFAVALAVPGNLNHWVTFTVAVKAFLLNITQYLQYSPQLGALNSGVRDLHNCMTWWDSLSVIDRRTRQAKTHVITVVEQAMLNECSSRTSEAVSVVSMSSSGKLESSDSEKAKNSFE